MARQLTINDLCQISGYSRHQMRGLLDELPMYSNRAGSARVARTYSAHDLLVVTLCCRLETRYGLKRQAVGEFAAEMAQALSRPNRVNRAARLILTYDPIRIAYVEQIDAGMADGLVIALEPVFAVVDEYLLPGHTGSPNQQHELNFGLLEIPADSPPQSSSVGLRSGSKGRKERA